MQQQCFECRISRICVPYSRSFKRNSIAASYQHHAGLQPANLVTSSTVPCSRSRKLFRSVRSFQVYAAAACTGVFFHTTSSIHPIFRLFPTVYDRYHRNHWDTLILVDRYHRYHWDTLILVVPAGLLLLKEQPPAAVELYYFYSAVRSSLPLPAPQLHLFYSAVRSSFFKSDLIANPKMIRTFSIVNQF